MLKALLVALIFSFGSAPAAFAGAGQARILYVLGQVDVKSSAEGGAHKAAVGDQLPVMARISTGGRSVATLELPDQSVIKIGPESEVSLLEFSATHGESLGATVISLAVGSLFSKVHKQTGQQKFEVRTKAASMGVRGTEFYTAIGQSKKDVWMCVREGEVAVQSAAGGGPVSVGKGEGVVVPAGKPATKPKPYSWTKKLNWNMDPKAGTVLDETRMDSTYGDLLDQNYD